MSRDFSPDLDDLPPALRAEPWRETWLAASPARIPGLPKHPALRLHPNLAWPFARLGIVRPALLAQITDTKGRAQGIFVRWLDPDTMRPFCGTLAQAVHGSLYPDGAVRFGVPDGTLGIAIEPEDAARAFARFSLPVWAAVRPGRLGSLALPAEAERVVVFAHPTEGALEQAQGAVDAYRRGGRQSLVQILPIELVGASHGDVGARAVAL